MCPSARRQRLAFGFTHWVSVHDRHKAAPVLGVRGNQEVVLPDLGFIRKLKSPQVARNATQE